MGQPIQGGGKLLGNGKVLAGDRLGGRGTDLSGVYQAICAIRISAKTGVNTPYQ
jgi:hypothetical protein